MLASFSISVDFGSIFPFLFSAVTGLPEEEVCATEEDAAVDVVVAAADVAVGHAAAAVAAVVVAAAVVAVERAAERSWRAGWGLGGVVELMVGADAVRRIGIHPSDHRAAAACAADTDAPGCTIEGLD